MSCMFKVRYMDPQIICIVWPNRLILLISHLHIQFLTHVRKLGEQEWDNRKVVPSNLDIFILFNIEWQLRFVQSKNHDRNISNHSDY